MWRSKEDIIKDLVYLNDFGVPGDKEPYKVFYSVGRGLKIKEKSTNQEKFIDQRTGEVISAEDEIPITNDVFYQSKGRGSLLGSFSKTKLQLQQQLRLARPLGSGDRAIESYCRRNTTIKNAAVSSSTSEPDAQNIKLPPEEPRVDPISDIKRVKGTRYQNLYSNVLIENLLSKAKSNSVIESTLEGKNVVNDEKNYKADISYYESNDNDSCNNKNNYNSSSSSSSSSSTTSNTSGGGGGGDEDGISTGNNSKCDSSIEFRECKQRKSIGNGFVPAKVSSMNDWKYLEENCGICKECRKNMTISEKKTILKIEGLRIIDDDDEMNEENNQNCI